MIYYSVSGRRHEGALACLAGITQAKLLKPSLYIPCFLFLNFAIEVSRSISMVTDEDPPDEVYPVEAENKVQDPHQDDLKEVHSLTNAKRGEAKRH